MPREADEAGRIGRAGLYAAILLCGVNLFTGGPLLAVWVGSKVQNEKPGSSTAAVAVLAVVLVLVELGLTRAVNMLTNRYDEATGYRQPRRQTAWLRPMSGERRSGFGAAPRISPSERLLVAIVVTAVIALEVILFLSHYNLSAPSSLLGLLPGA
jgi:hypothetical protein